MNTIMRRRVDEQSTGPRHRVIDPLNKQTDLKELMSERSARRRLPQNQHTSFSFTAADENISVESLNSRHSSVQSAASVQPV